jgi:hypothetical protein
LRTSSNHCRFHRRRVRKPRVRSSFAARIKCRRWSTKTPTRWPSRTSATRP